FTDAASKSLYASAPTLDGVGALLRLYEPLAPDQGRFSLHYSVLIYFLVNLHIPLRLLAE
ncbi:MAG: hypothetical protein AAF518_05535, partial [Spirochaetota bacterium]